MKTKYIINGVTMKFKSLKGANKFSYNLCSFLGRSVHYFECGKSDLSVYSKYTLSDMNKCINPCIDAVGKIVLTYYSDRNNF